MALLLITCMALFMLAQLLRANKFEEYMEMAEQIDKDEGNMEWR